MGKHFFAPIILLFLYSCGGNEPCKDCEVKKQDTAAAPVAQNLESALAAEDTPIAPSKEVKENHEKIVKKFGEQWDFCKCVVALDSITDAFEKTLTTAQEENLMKRWDYVDVKCKELTTNPSTTPEEREQHERKVRKCLKQNGLKM